MSLEGGMIMKATMKDVATLAGVGVGTVSRVINKNETVKPDTLRRVERAIKELNYEPNEYARGMKTRFTNTVALIIPTVWHPFFSEFAFHVESVLNKHGYKVYICNSQGSEQREFEYIQMVKQNRVDGIIGISYTDIDQYIDSNLPFVSIDRHFTEDVMYVTSDNWKAGELAFDELVKGGSVNLAFIGGHQDTPNDTKQRVKSFVASAEKHNFNYKVLDMVEQITDLYQQVEAFLIANPTIDCIFAINDLLALDVIEILNDLGKRVPEDVQVIGCDGIKLARERDYLLSTIRQPVEAMAEKSVDMLLKTLSEEKIDKRVVLDVSFVKGDTTR